MVDWLQMSQSGSVPNVLFIADGNRRWARDNNKDYAAGYERTAEVIHTISNRLGGLGARDVWFPVTRPFNNERDPGELEKVYQACTRVYEIGHEKGSPVNVRADGDLGNIPARYIEKMKQQEAAAQLGRITTHLIFDWSIETEIGDLVQRAQNNPDTPNDLESLRGMSVIDQPIDLVIRTGLLRSENTGRLSGFIPWHSGNADLVFVPVLFQDFTLDNLDAALDTYYNPEHKNQIDLS